MPQKFCHNCGKQVILGSKFCPECGVNLSSLSSKPVQSPSSTFTPFSPSTNPDDDDSYLDKIDHLQIKQTQLHVDIVKDKPVGESVGAVIAQSLQEGTPTTPDIARPVKYPDAKICLEEFQREAGTIRK